MNRKKLSQIATDQWQRSCSGSFDSVWCFRVISCCLMEMVAFIGYLYLCMFWNSSISRILMLLRPPDGNHIKMLGKFVLSSLIAEQNKLYLTLQVKMLTLTNKDHLLPGKELVQAEPWKTPKSCYLKGVHLETLPFGDGVVTLAINVFCYCRRSCCLWVRENKMLRLQLV